MYIFILHFLSVVAIEVVKSAANKHAMWEKLEWYILKNTKSW